MPQKNETELLRENAELRARLEEAEETLRAIRSGEVDALVVGEQVYSLKGAETPYRILLEQMSEGAATLLEDGAMLYANRRLAELLRTPLEALIGSSLRRFVVPAERPAFDTALAQGKEGSSKGQFSFQCEDGSTVPVQLSFCVVEGQDTRSIGVVATDLTERRQAEEALRRAHDTLEQRVIERTTELRQANEVLARFNRAMVDRELRMIELKKEVNELCAQAGQPPRYPLGFLKDQSA